MNFLKILKAIKNIRPQQTFIVPAEKALSPDALAVLQKRVADQNARSAKKLAKLRAAVLEAHNEAGVRLLDNILHFFQSDSPLYIKILPLCHLAYLYENNGEVCAHARKLADIFYDEKAVLNYLIKFGESRRFTYLLHDACLFNLPTSATRAEFWKKLANTGDNMLHPGFHKLLTNAKALETLAASKKIKPDHAALKDAETVLKNAIADYRKEKRTRKRAAILKELGKKKHEAYLKLGNLCIGLDFKKLTLLKLKALYEVYISEHKGHAFLIENGISEQCIQEFYALERNNDDSLIPDVLIDGEDIGYSGVYLKKLDIMSDEGAALAACLGKITNCCQYIGGAGGQCARHGIRSANGGFYVLFKGAAAEANLQDKVLAQAWVWKSQSGALCLDSVEKTHAASSETVAAMYRYLGHVLCHDYGVIRVNIGARSGISAEVGSKDYPVVIECPLDYNAYRDSALQLLLASADIPFLFRNLTSELFEKKSNNRPAPFFRLCSRIRFHSKIIRHCSRLWPTPSKKTPCLRL